MRFYSGPVLTALRRAGFSIHSLSLEAISGFGSTQYFTLCLDDEPGAEMVALDLLEVLHGIAVPFAVLPGREPGRWKVHLVADKIIANTANMYVQVAYNVTSLPPDDTANGEFVRTGDSH